MDIKISGHHLINLFYCFMDNNGVDDRVAREVQYFRDLYGDEFAQSAEEILKAFAEDRNSEICLVKGVDDICKQCSRFAECNGNPFQEWTDSECIEVFELEADKTYTLKALLEKVGNFIDVSQKELPWRRTLRQHIILKRLLEVSGGQQ